MVSNKQINMWKQLWDIFIADGAFRHYYTNYHSYDLTMNDTTPITNTKGTLYIPPKKREKEGHFIAYQMLGSDIHIFDPSAYAYQQFANNPDLAQSIALRSGKKVVKLTNHPQDLCQGDTFCQTWSLAWLKPNLKHLTNVRTMNNSINSIYTIVHTVSNNDKFIGYMLNPPNKTSFNKLIKKSQKEFKIPDSTCMINNVEEFVQFSQNITKNDIALIMMNKT
jgi:hypothetical protein